MSSPIYRQALEIFGTAPQLRQLQEEAAEVIVAANHFARGRGGAGYELAGEIADLEIMLEQARLIVGSEVVDRIKSEKLVRLSRLIAAHQSSRGGSLTSNEVPRG